MPDYRNIASSYSNKYSESAFLKKIAKCAKKIGATLLYQALLLFYALQSPKIPTKCKAAIMGALAYLVSPLDIIPDVIPILGFTDDAAVIAAVMGLVHANLDSDIQTKARNKMCELFGNDWDANEKNNNINNSDNPNEPLTIDV